MAVINDAPKMDWIKDMAGRDLYHISEHGMRFFLTGKISLKELSDAINNGKVLEIHRHPIRGNSSLVLGYSKAKPVHLMCAADEDEKNLIICFVYIPSLPVWKDPEHRSNEGEQSMNNKLQKCFFCGARIAKLNMGNYDYRHEGQLYVIKNMPAGLCLQCGEKYVTAEAAKRINTKIKAGNFSGTEKGYVLEYG